MKMGPLLYGGADYRRQMQYEAAVEKEQMQDLKVMQQIISTQSAQVGLDTANFRLKEMKDKAAREADMHQMLPQIVDRQMDIINNPSLSPYEQQQELNALRMQLGPSAMTNPAISATFNSSNNITNSAINQSTRDAAEQEKKDRLARAEQDKEERRMITIMDTYSKTGNVKDLETYVQNLPADLAGVGEAFISSAKATQATTQRGISEKAQKESEARRKQFFEFNKSILDRISKLQLVEDPDDLDKQILPAEDIRELATTIDKFYNTDPKRNIEYFIELGEKNPEDLINMGLDYAMEAMGGKSAVMPSAQSRISGSMDR